MITEIWTPFMTKPQDFGQKEFPFFWGGGFIFINRHATEPVSVRGKTALQDGRSPQTAN